MRKIFIFYFSLLLGITAMGQIGINTDTPHPETDLELGSPNKALLLNRVESANNIQNPEAGMIVFDLTDECIKVYQKGAWSCLDIVLNGNEPDPDPGYPFGIPDTIPQLILTTDDGEDIPQDEKKVYKPGDIIVEGMGLGDYSGRYSLRGRGHGTWTHPKKPYRLKLDNKEPLLGMRKEKSYILLNEYSDGHMFENALPYKMAEQLGMPHTNRFVPVLLNLNGEDRGVYAFTEQKHVKTNRIELDDDGLLLELDGHYDDEPKWRYRAPEVNTPITVQYPEFEDSEDPYTDPLFLQIKSDFNNLLSLLYNEGADEPLLAAQDLIDTEQAANYYIIWQITRNADFTIPNSMYVHKQNAEDKYKMGIVWDFDNAFGFREKHHFYHPESTDGNSVFSIYNWCTPIVNMFKLPEVKSKIKERWDWWKENKMDEYFEFFDRYSELIRQGIDIDHSIWGNRNGSTDDFEANKAKYLFWLNGRIAWMDDHIDAL